MVLADPVGSVLADYVQTGNIGEAGSWLVEGIGEDFIPPIADLSRVRTAYPISDEESLNTARDLLRVEGVLAGSSSGTLLAAALKYCKEQSRAKRVVTFVCDSGNKYLSKMYNDFWMADHGFRKSKPLGDLRDLIVRRFSDGAVISVTPDEPMSAAYSRMRLYDVSQLPVVADAKVVGILDESDLLMAVADTPSAFRMPVKNFMTTKLETVSRHAPVDDLLPIFDSGRVAIVADQQGFHGLITRVDVLNFLRARTRLPENLPRSCDMSTLDQSVSQSRVAVPVVAPAASADPSAAAAETPHGLRHAGHSRRPVARSHDRRRDDADLRHEHLRAAVARSAQGV